MTSELPTPDASEAHDVKALLTIAQFCARYNISVGLYHKLRRAGKGPAVVEILGAVRIAPQAAEAWVARMQAESDQQKAAQPGGMSSAHAVAGRLSGGAASTPRRPRGVQPTFPSGKPIGRPRKTDASR